MYIVTREPPFAPYLTTDKVRLCEEIGVIFDVIRLTIVSSILGGPWLVNDHCLVSHASRPKVRLSNKSAVTLPSFSSHA